MTKLILPGLLLALAGFGCGGSSEETTAVRAETVTVGAESEALALEEGESTLPPTTYVRTECALNEVQFPAGEHTLDEDGYRRLDELSVCLRAGEIAQLHVLGVDDPDLEPAEEHRLAERRAMLVVDYLLDEGLDEPDVRYEDRHDIEGFVLVWPGSRVAVAPSPQG